MLYGVIQANRQATDGAGRATTSDVIEAGVEGYVFQISLNRVARRHSTDPFRP